jgi:hypothetical protein
MKSVRASRKWCGLKYRLLENFKENKKTTLFLILLATLGLLTGIFTAIRYSQGAVLINFNDLSLSQFLRGDLGTYNFFFSRLFSTLVISFIIFFCSLSIFLVPVGFIVLAYRSYLLGLNATIIIIFNGVGGIISCMLIIIPCQIISLLIIAIFCSFVFKKAYLKRKYGMCEIKIWDKFLITVILLIIINLIETFLLYIFSSKIILVI